MVKVESLFNLAVDQLSRVDVHTINIFRPHLSRRVAERKYLHAKRKESLAENEQGSLSSSSSFLTISRSNRNGSMTSWSSFMFQ
jgi:hypothetical protein